MLLERLLAHLSHKEEADLASVAISGLADLSLIFRELAVRDCEIFDRARITHQEMAVAEAKEAVKVFYLLSLLVHDS